MFTLNENDIHVQQSANNKNEAIKKICLALVENGYVSDGYEQGMLDRENQISTYLGSLIAIPHGTPETKNLVKKTGLQVFFFPDGVVWGDDGEKAHLVIGIAASSNEHLTILRQLARILGDDDIEDRILQIKSAEDIKQLLLMNG